MQDPPIDDANPYDEKIYLQGVEITRLRAEIDGLASYIMEHVEGEPSESEGACRTAARIMKSLRAENERLREERDALQKFFDEFDSWYAVVTFGTKVALPLSYGMEYAREQLAKIRETGGDTETEKKE
jgi:hypothetical protein